MDRKVKRQQTLDNYKRKRNSILFLLIVPAAVIIGSLIVFYFFNTFSLTNLITIYMLLIIADFIVISLLAPKLYLYKMHYDYAKLTLHEPHFLKAEKQLFTTTWIEELKNEGYEVVQEDIAHMLLCKLYKKLPNIPNSDKTLVFIVVAKNNSFDFYGDEIDIGIQSAYMNNVNYQKINKQVTLQFKKYDMINEDATTEIESAILYQTKSQVLVNLTFGYVKDKNSVYCINPAGWFPNRYVYFAFAELRKLCGIRDDI